MGYDDYRPVSKFKLAGGLYSLERAIQVRAADEVAAAGHANAPKRGDFLSTAYGLLYLAGISIDQVPGSAGDANDAFLFEITANYESLTKAPTENKARWVVQSQNESAKLRAVPVSGYQRHYYAEAGSGDEVPTPYLGQGINVTQDGAEGVDVDDPFEVLRIDLWLAPSAVAAKLAVLRELVNRTNAAAFSGPWGTYAAGDARLTGYTVSHLGEDLDQISIEIQHRDEITFTVDLPGGNSASVRKEGQEYYWQRMAPLVTAGDDTQAPESMIDAHVAGVYRSGDFSGLGITYAMFDATEPS